MSKRLLGLVLTGFLCTDGLLAEGIDRRIPDEYEAVGGHALALDNAGIAALGDASAIRTNPALLPLERQYSVSANYHWPTSGREFYQASVIDSVTSEIAAGLSGTGFSDSYESYIFEDEPDARTEKRLAIALAKAFHKFSFGLTAQYVAGHLPKEDEIGFARVKGSTVGFGVGAFFTPKLRFGLSAENLGNKKVAELAPRVYRAGIAFLTLSGDLTLHLDYRNRERVESIEGTLPNLGYTVAESELAGYTGPEQMVIASFSARIYNVLRLLGAYGHAVSEDKRRTLSGGVGLVHNLFSISFAVSRPYLDYPDVHNAVNLNFLMAL